MDEDVRSGSERPADDDHGLLSDAERAITDSEQTLADLDQTASDKERALAEFDQTSADIDQHASDRDQFTADRDARDRDGSSDSADDRAAARYATSRADRLSTTLARYATSADRLEGLRSRDAVADRRDDTAAARDEAAAARDRIAARRDQRATRRTADPEALAELLADTRLRAGEGRERAANDRRQAAMDRVQAARDRQFAREALRHTHHDWLTGALNREVGEHVLRGDVERAHSDGRPLTLAFIHVAGDVAPDDTEASAADDEVLACIAAAMQRHLLPFDTAVRYGEHEFVCAMPDTSSHQTARRLLAISDDVAAECGRVIRVGTAELQADESVATLIARAEAELSRGLDLPET